MAAAANAGAPVLQGSPVVLRPLRPADVEQFLVWARDRELRQCFLGHVAAEDEDDDLEWVPRCGGKGRTDPGGPPSPRSSIRLTRAIDTLEGRLLGWVELRDVSWRRRTGELRICLGDPGTWGNGYGTAALRSFLECAFDQWHLREIHLRVATWNARALQVYERCGFRRQARLWAGPRERDGLEDLWLMTAVATEFKA